MKLVSAHKMRSLDHLAIRKYGVKGIVLMENAGRGVAEVVAELLCKQGKGGRVSIVAGKGNNGGDGFVAARHLRNQGFGVAVLSMAGVDFMKGDAGINARIWKKMEGETLTLLSRRDIKKHLSVLKHSAVIVDGLLGTGLDSPVRGLYAEVIDLINTLNKKVVAVDIPSGLDASIGSVLGSAVKATVTVTMGAAKAGLFVYPGRDYSGRVEVVDIGMPRELLEGEDLKLNLTDEDYVRGVLRPRNADTHKGSFGHVVVLAGSPGRTGAAYMTAMGAMRAGTGLVTVGVAESLNPIMEAKTTEAMTYPLPETRDSTLGRISCNKAKELIEGKDALVIGPGLGASEDIFGLMESIIPDCNAALIIDADGLNVLEGRVKLLKRVKADTVLTPHPGEMARLLKVSTKEVQADRIGAARKLSDLTGCIVVLKGAGTIISEPGGGLFINPTGNPGLASAGTGDVLSGMIGGLMAQGYGALDSAAVATYIHGLAGDRVKEKSGPTGMVATDLLEHIPTLVNSYL